MKKTKAIKKLHIVVNRAIDRITNPAIRRISRRAGIKRINAGLYNEVRQNMDEFLQKILFAATTYTKHARRVTTTLLDVQHALKFEGQTLYT